MRFRNTGVDLRHFEEPNGHPLDMRVPRENFDFNEGHQFDGPLSWSDSEGSDGFHTVEENLSNDESGVVEMEIEEVRRDLILSPGRRLGLGEDPYAEFAPGRQPYPPIVYPTNDCGKQKVDEADREPAARRMLDFDIGRTTADQVPIPPLAANLPTPPRHFFQWASTPIAFGGSTPVRLGTGGGNNLENSFMHRDVENPSIMATMLEFDEDPGDAEYECIVEASTILSLGIRNARRMEIQEIHCNVRANSSPFLRLSPADLGGLPNLPLTEFDPPNTPVSHLSSFNFTELFNYDDSANTKKRIRKAVGHMPLSIDGDSIRYSEIDYEWVERKRLKRLHRWSDKGGFSIWINDENGRKKFASKAISDPDMAREFGVGIDDDLLKARVKNKRLQEFSSSSSGSFKRQKSEEVTLAFREVRDDMDIDLQLSILDLMLG
uniref:Uncharacterized protein n=1 Tax=Chenopodium quinoa TaxID=63459 RepID=A0A803MF02_CHEQI